MTEDALGAFDPNTADGQFYAIWKAMGPLPDEPHDRDLNLYAAGAKAALVVMGGESGAQIADLLIAGLFLRDAIEAKPDFTRRAGGPAEAGPPKESA